MATSDKNIVITPNVGQAADPKIVFSGADSVLGPQNITLQVYPTNNGTVSFEGSAGQLFSITNSLSGSLFSVNDVSGIPSIEILDTGTVKIAQYSGNVGIGISNPGAKLTVVANTATDAVRITQIGAGNALLVEDSANPDSTPFVVAADGKVGVGTTSPTSNFTVEGLTEIRSGNYLMLRPSANNWDMRLQAVSTQLNFYSGGDLGTPIVSMLNGGNVGVGTTAPAGKLEVSGGRSWFTANSEPYSVAFRYAAATGVMYMGATNSASTPSIQFSNSGGATLVTIDYSGNVSARTYTSTVATGTAPFTVASTTRVTNLNAATAGNADTVTNGVYTSGDQTIAGVKTFSGTLNWGNGGTRVYTKDDAGAIASKSGFFESASPVNYYTGASSWQHMIESRHSNDGNNYAMQIAGSFFDQSIYFRKTNNSPTTAWTQFLTTSFCAVSGAITATGDITAFFSDDRLKTRLGTITDAVEKVKSLTGFYYEANETAQALGYESKREIGISAQDVEKILPEIVAPAPIDKQYLTIKYEKLAPLFIEAIKEQQAKIDKLEILLMQVINGKQ